MELAGSRRVVGGKEAPVVDSNEQDRTLCLHGRQLDCFVMRGAHSLHRLSVAA